MPDKTLVLVDGSYYLFRAYHAMPAFTNSAGEPTGAIFGVVNMIHKLLDEYRPDYFAVVFDAKGKNFRNEIYPDYKAHRPPMPDELVCQIEPLHEIIRAEGFPLLIMDNVEADDVIATLAKSAAEKGIKTIISTGDKDLAQIVENKIHLINTMNNKLLDPEGVKEKFGVKPGQIIDYLSLVGDSVDNVPGVPKVGRKTAAKWISEFGSVDALVQNADNIKGKVGENLRASIDQIPVSRQLVTLKTDLNLEIQFNDLVRGEPDYEVLSKAFKRWNFNSWLARLQDEFDGHEDPPGSTNDTEYEVILSDKQLSEWIKRIKKAELVAFDTETTSLKYMDAKLVGMSFAIEPHKAAYLPLGHDYPDAPVQLSLIDTLEKLTPLLTADNLKKVGHHIKYDMNILANYGIELNGIQHDSMLESYVLDSTASRHDMDTLALRHLDYQTTTYEQVAGTGSKQLTFNEVNLETGGPYAAEDADISLRLHQAFWSKLSKEKGLKEVYEKLEVPLIKVLSRMERNGVLIDVDMLREQSKTLNKEMDALLAQAHDVAGEVFNIGSPKQIQEILFEKLQLPVISKTPKGQPSTAESVLQELAHEHELPRLILEHRTLSKLKTTYTDKLPDLVNQQTGRVHTSYHQAVASTGRLSSSEPNLQNIPVRTEEGRKIRKAFVAPTGFAIVAADYSQIELRIMAHLSGDTTLKNAFTNGTDIHKTTAAEIFSTDVEKITPEQRRSAKAINFGLIYGMSPYGLSKQLGIDVGTAKEYVDTYFERYPAVKSFMDNIREQAKADGYVETLFKRRLYLPDINSRNAARRQYAERTAINAPMQGTAADLIKRAMIEIDSRILAKTDKIRMIMQVHDELVFEIAEDRIDNTVDEIKKIMSSTPELDIPITLEVGIGPNWEQAH
jgi:DNA polymerase-1